ncbi:GAF domain-containing sensor histidine kinase [Tundrisphaera lichenicola]|uniref:GAF domain-containing sensor histidine kinase n=1 Tax=Tundrisphaera lichenicola TaxID=2029860 RepID=UPI003EB70D3E
MILDPVRDERECIIDFRIGDINESCCRHALRAREELMGRMLLDSFPFHRDSGIFDLCCLAFDAGKPGEIRELILGGHPLGGDPSRTFATRVARIDDGIVVAWHDDTNREKEISIADRLRNRDKLDRAILESKSPREIAETALRLLAQQIPISRGRVALFDLDARQARTLALFDERSTGGRSGMPPSENLDDGFDFSLAADPGGELVPNRQGFRSEDRRPFVEFQLRDRIGRIGLLELDSDRREGFSAGQLAMAREFASLIAIGLRQAALVEEAREFKSRLKSLSLRLIAAEEVERRRISRELHDETGQILMAIKLNLRPASGPPGDPVVPDRLDVARSLIDRAIGQVRTLAHELRPSLLDDFGLVPALRSLVNRAGIPARFLADPSIDRCDPEIETACYRIAQEALNNSSKHARATSVKLELALEDHHLKLIVTDDGVGFDVTEATSRAEEGSSLGILGMRERAALAGGQLSIRSEAAAGTEIIASFPGGTLLESQPSSTR